MVRYRAMRRCYWGAALALVVGFTGLQPGMAAIRRASPSTARHTTAAARASAIHGTLVAVHRAARVGDLALDDGTLTALRFASAFQASGAQVGARLVVTVATPGSARPLVQALHVTGRATTVRLRGVVARVLPRESIEILGTHGAAVIVQLDGASGLTTLRPGARYSARTEDRPAIVLSGSEVDLHLRIGATGALAVRQARLVHAHVGRIEVEGIVKATNPHAGTITIENEDGQRTVVAVGAQARVYYVGEQAEASGILSGTHVTATRARGDDGSDRHGNQGGSGHAGASAMAAMGATGSAAITPARPRPPRRQRQRPPARNTERSAGRVTTIMAVARPAVIIPAHPRLRPARPPLPRRRATTTITAVAVRPAVTMRAQLRQRRARPPRRLPRRAATIATTVAVVAAVTTPALPRRRQAQPLCRRPRRRPLTTMATMGAPPAATIPARPRPPRRLRQRRLFRPRRRPATTITAVGLAATMHARQRQSAPRQRPLRPPRRPMTRISAVSRLLPPTNRSAVALPAWYCHVGDETR